MAASTRSRVSSRTNGESLSTRDTVWCDTPATLATSAMLGPRPSPTPRVVVMRHRVMTWGLAGRHIVATVRRGGCRSGCWFAYIP